MRSFNRLFLSRRYDEIQVDQIIDQAEVGRSTFYEHFRSKDAVLLQAAEGILQTLSEAAGERANLAAMEHMLKHFQEVGAAARSMLRGESVGPLRRRLAELFEQRLAELARETGRNLAIPARLAGVQLAESLLGVIREWLCFENACSARSLAEVLHRTTRQMALAMLVA